MAKAESLPIGVTTFDLGAIAAPGVFGGRAELLTRITKDVAGYAEGRGEYNFGRRTMDWGAMVGLRGRF